MRACFRKLNPRSIKFSYSFLTYKIKNIKVFCFKDKDKIRLRFNLSISLVHGDMLKSVSKNFYRNIYSNFTLTKKAKILCNGDLKPSNNYIRLFSGLNNYIWFFRDDKINQVTYYFGQTEKDNTNNDLSNIEPLKPVFSVTFNLKKSNLSNGRFFTDEKGNIIGNILVNRLKDKQYDLLKKLGLKINTLKNKKNNENKH